MKEIYSDILRSWRIIEEITPIVIETDLHKLPKTKSHQILQVVQKILDDEEILWIQPNRPRNEEISKTKKEVYTYSVFLGALQIDLVLKKVKEILNIKLNNLNYDFDAKKRTFLVYFSLNDDGKFNKNSIEIPDYVISIAARIEYKEDYDNLANYKEFRGRLEQKITDVIENTFSKLASPIEKDCQLNSKYLRQLNKDILKIIGWNIKDSSKLISNDVIIYQNKWEILLKKEEEETEDESTKNFFKSFFLNDIRQAEIDIKNNNNSPILFKYLSRESEKKIDIVKEDYYKNKVTPENIMPVRWPTKDDHPLVLAQNLAVKEALDTKDIFSVNGPPGTGKTTILSDIVANLIFLKAQKISKLDNPKNIFTNQSFSFISESNYNFKGYLLDEDFLDMLTVVTSSNNEAVENITKNLPINISSEWDIDYFKKEAEDIFDKDNVLGLFSVALGNKKNRREFFDKFWKNDKKDENNDLINPVCFKNTLKNSKITIEEWESTKEEFKDKLEEFDDLIKKFSEIYKYILEENDQKLKIDELEKSIFQIKKTLKKIDVKIKKSNEIEDLLWKNVQIQNSLLEIERNNKPSFLEIIVSFFKNNYVFTIWKERIKKLNLELDIAKKPYLATIQEIILLKQQKENLENDLDNKTEERDCFLLNNQKMEIFKKENQHLFDLGLPNKEFWEQSDELIQISTPWLFPEIQKIRAEIFKLSNELIKNTILINKEKLNSNLNIINMMMRYGDLPNNKQEYAKHVWNSFALIIPVISTTLASFSNLFKDLGREEIATLLVDEAGQISPHKAVGAIWRSKKAIIVGDPLQIEPVETLPAEIGEEILKANKVDPKYNPLGSSMQIYADLCNNLGTYIETEEDKLWIGFPLRVHRRCQNPMFKISNQIAYNNLMIHKVSHRSCELQRFFPKSLWIDVRNTYAKDKWVEEEGTKLLEILYKITNQTNKLPNIYIISPFYIISNNIKHLLRDSWAIANVTKNNLEKWINKHVGTIHSFQGKEADMVIMVLGCDKKSVGAVNIMTAKPNVLNVAITRAKYNILVIGNSKIWGSKHYFDVLINNIDEVLYD